MIFPPKDKSNTATTNGQVPSSNGNAPVVDTLKVFTEKFREFSTRPQHPGGDSLYELATNRILDSSKAYEQTVSYFKEHPDERISVGTLEALDIQVKKRAGEIIEENKKRAQDRQGKKPMAAVVDKANAENAKTHGQKKREHLAEFPDGCKDSLTGACEYCPDNSEKNRYFCATGEFPGLHKAPKMTKQYYGFSKNDGKPSGFKPAVLGSWLIDNFNFVVGTDNELYRYVPSAGLYKRSDDWVKAAVALNHGMGFTGRADLAVLNWLYSVLGSRGQRVDLAAPLPGGLINLRNGVLNPWTEELVEHGPQYQTCIQIPVSWNPSAVCPAIDKFLSEAVFEDSIDLVWELIGYSLSGSNKYQKAELLFGPGGNGKTRLLDVVRGLLGDENYSAMSLHQIADNRFMAADLHGKLGNVCGDIGKDKVQHAETIKNIVGQDPFTVERKNKNPFTLEPYTMLIFSGNAFPKVLDATPGFFDKFIVVDMPVKFRGVVGKEDVDLKDKITTQDELQGALVKAVRALARLESRGLFELPQRSLELGKKWRRDSDSRIAFVHECVETDPDGVVSKPAINAQYKMWCEFNGVGHHSSQKLGDILRDIGAVPGFNSDGNEIWKGIKCVGGASVANVYGL